MTLDEYAAWAAGIGVNRHPGVPEDRTLLEIGLGFASEIGEVAGVVRSRAKIEGRLMVPGQNTA